MTEVGLFALFMFVIAFGLSFLLAQLSVPRFIWGILILATGLATSALFIKLENKSHIETIFYFILFFLFVTFGMTVLHQDIKNDSKNKK